MTALLAPPHPMTERHRSSSFVMIVALLSAVLGVAGMWWNGTSPTVGASPGTALIAVSELTGLLAGLGVPMLLLLIGRVPWFERAVGFDRLVAWHRSLGTTVVFLVLTHLLTMLVGGMIADRQTAWGELNILFTSIPDMLITVIGTVMFLTAGAMSARAIRRRISYEAWFAVHISLYVGIYLAFWHQIAAGTHLLGHLFGVQCAHRRPHQIHHWCPWRPFLRSPYAPARNPRVP